MKLEEQVCSLELAKKLKSLGVKQESFHHWKRLGHSKPYELDAIGSFETADNESHVSAFTVAELGEMLPIDTEIQKGDMANGEPANWYVTLWKGTTEGGATEAEARAKMLVYLIENNLTNPMTQSLDDHIEDKIKEIDLEFEERGAVRHESLVAAFRGLAAATVEACGVEEKRHKVKKDDGFHEPFTCLMCAAEDNFNAAVSEQKRKAEEWMK